MIEGHDSPCSRGIIEGWSPSGTCAEAAKPWVLAASILGSSMAVGIFSSSLDRRLEIVEAPESAKTAVLEPCAPPSTGRSSRATSGSWGSPPPSPP